MRNDELSKIYILFLLSLTACGVPKISAILAQAPLTSPTTSAPAAPTPATPVPATPLPVPTLLPSDTPGAPRVFNPQPSGLLTSGTTHTSIGLNTDIPANCIYAQTANDLEGWWWDPIVGHFDGNSGTPITGLADGQNYIYYIKCRNAVDSTKVSYGTVVFSVATPATSPILMASHNFKDGTFGPFNPSQDVDIVQDPTGSGRGKVARIHYAGVFQDRNRGFTWNHDLLFGQTLWFRGDFYVPANGVNAQRKLVYFQSTNWATARSFWAVVSSFGGGMSAGWHIDGGSISSDVTWNGGSFSFGAWHRLEIQISIGSALGASDGVYQIYCDGVLVKDMGPKQFTDPAWVGVYNPSTIIMNAFIIGQQEDTNATGGMAYDEYRYWDNVSFSTQRLP